MSLEPIVHEYPLTCTPEAAFDAYVQRISEWWDPRHTANASTLKAVTIDPYVGGRVFESHQAGLEIDWGRVKIIEPGRRLVYSSSLAQPSDRPSEITVRFTPSAKGCRLRFEHGGWDERNAMDRVKFREWDVILSRLVALTGSAHDASTSSSR